MSGSSAASTTQAPAQLGLQPGFGFVQQVGDVCDFDSVVIVKEEGSRQRASPEREHQVFFMEESAHTSSGKIVDGCAG